MEGTKSGQTNRSCEIRKEKTGSFTNKEEPGQEGSISYKGNRTIKIERWRDKLKREIN